MLGSTETLKLFAEQENFSINTDTKIVVLKLEVTINKNTMLKEFVIDLKERKGEGGMEELKEEVARLREEVEELKSRLGNKELQT